MPLFKYRAVGGGGKRVEGVIDADSYVAAKEKLRREQVMVTALETLKEQQRLKLSAAVLLSFTRELGQLLRASLPLYESLVTVEEKYRAHKVHPLFLDLCDRLKGGASLHAALAAYPESFDAVYLAMVKAGEATASLPYVFEEISQLLTRQQKLKKQLISAMTYPAILGGFCLLVTLSLLCFVIPAMQELFEGRTLHPLTQTVLSISKFITGNGTLLLSILFFSTIALFFGMKTPRFKMAIQQQVLRFPLLKTMVIQSALIRFSRAASVLLSGGVSLIEAFSLSRRVMSYAILEKVFEEATKRVTEGGKMSEELKKSAIVPQLVTRMLAISEETGKIGPMLQHVADIYEEDLEKSLSQLTTLLQPALLILLGVIVGVVILSVLIPLTDVSSFLAH
jgi:general secretion pathway protein F